MFYSLQSECRAVWVARNMHHPGLWGGQSCKGFDHTPAALDTGGACCPQLPCFVLQIAIGFEETENRVCLHYDQFRHWKQSGSSRAPFSAKKQGGCVILCCCSKTASGSKIIHWKLARVCLCYTAVLSVDVYRHSHLCYRRSHYWRIKFHVWAWSTTDCFREAVIFPFHLQNNSAGQYWGASFLEREGSVLPKNSWGTGTSCMSQSQHVVLGVSCNRELP